MKNFIFLSFSIFLLQCSIAQSTSLLFSEKMKTEMCEKVKETLRHSWQGYKQFAWGADDLKLLTKQPFVWYRQSMLITPVDAFDTFIFNICR